MAVAGGAAVTARIALWYKVIGAKMCVFVRLCASFFAMAAIFHRQHLIAGP